jgi:hypothetical protein
MHHVECGTLEDLTHINAFISEHFFIFKVSYNLDENIRHKHDKDPVIILEVSITNYIGISKSSDHLQIESFISTIGTIFVSSNSAAPFYIYLAVSSTFRRDLKKLITKLGRSMVGRIGMPGNQGPVQLQS